MTRALHWLIVAVPMTWLLIFFLAPFLIALKISVSEPAISSPPYQPILRWSETGWPIFMPTGGNYEYLISDSIYSAAYLESVAIAAISTLLALFIGYPIALYIAFSPAKVRNILLLLIVLPFWTSFLLRVYAWIGLLKDNGTINNLLLSVGLVSAPIQMMQTDFAVVLGMVYSYLPFMILPIYANLSRFDSELLEAASDLGATPFQKFCTILLPLSWPGILAGSLLVFIPAVGEYLIPALLGGPDTLMIGRILWDEFFSNRDWPVASAVAIVILISIVVPMAFLRNRFGREL